jgi:hypothetical protein
MAFAQRQQRGEARTAVNHVVLAVHLKPQAIGPSRQRFVEVLQFEAEAGGNVHG